MIRYKILVICIHLVPLLIVGTACDNTDDEDGSPQDAGDGGDADADADGDGDADSDADRDTESDADVPELLDPGEVCADESIDMGLAPLDMLLALDTSFSMDFAPDGEALTKWQAVVGAIKAFVSDPSSEGLSVGIQYFPLRRLCNVTNYGIPAVPISVLPDASETIAFSLDGQRMASGTPMVPMLQGTIAYAREWAAENPDRRTVVVMATDGIPDNTCQVDTDGALPNTIENVVQVASDGTEGSPSVPTFVIGVGAELTSLNQISQAGNGQDAILVDTESGNVQESFQDALEAIRQRSNCEFELSDMRAGHDLDFSRVNVLFIDEETILNNLPDVGDVGGCGAVHGWYYDNPSDPYRITLCEDTCELVTTRRSGALELRFACGLI